MFSSMKSGKYHVYLLLGKDGELATICSATCDCAAGLVFFYNLCWYMYIYDSMFSLLGNLQAVLMCLQCYMH